MKRTALALALATCAAILVPHPVVAQSTAPILLPGGCGTGNITNSIAYTSVNSSGEFCVSGAGGGGGLSVTDQAAWTQAVSAFTPGGCTFNDAATLTSGLQGTFRCNSVRGLIVATDAANPLSVTAIGVAQGSTTSGQTGSLVMGAVTTAAPSYTNGQTSPVSLTPAGDTRVLAARSSQYPLGATAITASATGTTGATTATLAGTSGKTTYICGYSIRANATAAATVTNTITGVITATLSSIMWVAPLASGIGIDEQIFMPCIPASATNTGIAIVSGAPGSGGTVSSKGWGYQL